MRDDPPDLIDWLGLRNIPDFRKSTWLGGLLGGATMLLLGIAALAALYAFLIVVAFIFGSDFRAQGTDMRDLGYVLIGLLGTPFIVWRSWVAQRQADIAGQGLITDRINKAVAGLGTEKNVKRRVWKKRIAEDGTESEIEEIEETTEPNVEVRIGAIYALERISQDSARDHIQIMEILCAYIRQNAPAARAVDFPLPDWPALPDGVNLDTSGPREIAMARSWAISSWVRDLRSSHTPRRDIQAALDVIGRRRPDRIALERRATHRGGKPYDLDLRATNLQAADLSGLNFDNADFSNAWMQGAILQKAQLQGAILRDAQLQGAYLGEAQLQGADLEDAQLQGAYLVYAQLQRAVLGCAHLQGAVLVEAQLQGAELWEAQLQGANLGGAQLQGADLRGLNIDAKTGWAQVALRGAGLRDADLSMLSLCLQDFEGSFGDGSVTVPAAWGEARPSGWVREKLSGYELYARWRAHQASIGYHPAEPDD